MNIKPNLIAVLNKSEEESSIWSIFKVFLQTSKGVTHFQIPNNVVPHS